MLHCQLVFCRFLPKGSYGEIEGVPTQCSKGKGEKTGIPVAQIARQSGGTITDSYIFDIMSGKTKHISVDKLEALALGLGMDSVELFKITIGYKPAPDPGQDLTAILKILVDMTPKERTRLLASLRKKK